MIKERDHVVRIKAGTWGRFEGKNQEPKTYRVGDTLKCTAEELESHRFQVELVSGPEVEAEVEADEPEEEPEPEPETGLASQLEEAGLPDIGGVHFATARKAIEEADPAHLELLRASENARDGGPRDVVLKALDEAESGE